MQKILDDSPYSSGGQLLQVEFLTGQVAGAESELSRREDATQLLGESEQARREVTPVLKSLSLTSRSFPFGTH